MTKNLSTRLGRLPGSVQWTVAIQKPDLLRVIGQVPPRQDIEHSVRAWAEWLGRSRPGLPAADVPVRRSLTDQARGSGVHLETTRVIDGIPITIHGVDRTPEAVHRYVHDEDVGLADVAHLICPICRTSQP